MKFLIVFAVVLAVASAQFGSFNRGRPQAQPFQYRPQAQLRPAASAVTVTRAAPPRASNSDQNANVVRYESDITPEGGYSYSFETDNGISAQEQGTPRDLGKEGVVAVAQGSYAYTSPEGQQVSIQYIADENGFQPQGDVLPIAPPIPPQIARALEWLARNAPAQRKK